MELPCGRSCILFVDDETLLVDLGHQMVASLGYEVVTCRSRVQALECFRAEPYWFDLVITDQPMLMLTGEW